MAVIYCCGNEKRRAVVRSRSGTFNGIDYVVVTVGDGPGAVTGQSTLTVQFIFDLTPPPMPPTPPPLSWTVSIQGGIRGVSVPITSVTQTTVLTIVTPLPPDSGKYTLTLQPVPSTGFDAYLLAVDFYFQNTSITSVDCQPLPAPAQSPPPSPQIDYLAKDFSSFQGLMFDRLSTLSPDWNERNPADLGSVLVDLLAYAADQLSYYQDAVATEAYLGTARKRISVGRHARLFSYYMHQGCNSRALVCVELAAGSPVELQAGHTWFLSHCQDQPVVLGQSVTDVPVQLLDSLRTQYGAAVFEPMQDTTLHPEHNVFSFYTWGDAECCLPAGSTRASLLSNGLAPAAGSILIFVESLNPVTGLGDDVDPKRRCAVRLTSVSTVEDLLNPLSLPTPVNVHMIEWEPADALPISLVLSARIGTTDRTDISVALGNVVLVDHGQTIPSEPLIPSAPVIGESYRPILQRLGLTFKTTQAGLAQLPASVVTNQEPSAAFPALTCSAPDASTWSPAVELLHSRSFDRQFVAEMDDDGQAILRFGDGTLGMSPVSGLVATYRIGNGAVGNVAADSIYHIISQSSPTAFRRVHNPLPASGGSDPELISEVRLNVPQSFRSQERGITADDYTELATRFADVARVTGEWRWTGAYRTIYLTVLRTSGQVVDKTFQQNLRAYLERYRLLGTEIVIEPPLFVALDISLTVHLADNALRSVVRDALLQSLSDVALASGKRGLFHPANFGFGQPVYLGQVLAVISQVPGVLWVDTSTTIATNRFQRLGSTHNELASGKIVLGRTEIARLGSIPGVPSFGNLEFHLEGGL